MYCRLVVSQIYCTTTKVQNIILLLQSTKNHKRKTVLELEYGQHSLCCLEFHYEHFFYNNMYMYDDNASY